MIDPNSDYNLICEYNRRAGMKNSTSYQGVQKRRVGFAIDTTCLVLLPLPVRSTLWHTRRLLVHWHTFVTNSALWVCHTTCAGHDHHERDGLMLDGSWTNFVDYSCAYNMHFTNWFSDRLAWAAVGGVDGDFVPLTQSQLADLHALFQSGKCCGISLRDHLYDVCVRKGEALFTKGPIVTQLFNHNPQCPTVRHC
jgi:hypothetical protein